MRRGLGGAGQGLGRGWGWGGAGWTGSGKREEGGEGGSSVPLALVAVHAPGQGRRTCRLGASRGRRGPPRAQALCHAPNVPGLIRFYGAFHAADKGQIAVVLEYMDGGSLADVLAKVGRGRGGAGRGDRRGGCAAVQVLRAPQSARLQSLRAPGTEVALQQRSVCACSTMGATSTWRGAEL